VKIEESEKGGSHREANPGQPDNHQPSQSSICTAHVELNVSVYTYWVAARWVWAFGIYESCLCILACPLSDYWCDLNHCPYFAQLCAACRWRSVAVTNHRFPCEFQLQPSLLQVANAAVQQLPSLWVHGMFRLRENFKCVHFKRPQANKQTDVHMHLCNAVPLVWGLLRLTPKM